MWGLAHEIRHALDWIMAKLPHIQNNAILTENSVRYGFYECVPGYDWLYPRPLEGKYKQDWTGLTAEKAWEKWNDGHPYPIFFPE